MYSLLQSHLILLTVLWFQKGNVDTPLTVSLFPLECSYLECLKAYKFAELLRVTVPYVTWLFKVYRKGTHHP